VAGLHDAGDSYESLLARADAAMYRDKRSSRRAD
jgi:PleD family two-component response regulator